MLNLTRKISHGFVFLFALTLILACSHQQPLESKDKDVEIWELRISGQTRGNLKMIVKRVEIDKDRYSITGKISGAIVDHKAGIGDAAYNFEGKIENNVLKASFGGYSKTSAGISMVKGRMDGTVEGIRGSGSWSVSHDLGFSSGEYTMSQTN